MAHRMKLPYYLLFLGLLSFMACEEVNENYQAEAAQADFLHRSMQQLTDVIVHDIFSPPVASRIYAYPSIAAYEVLRHDHPAYKSMVGQLNGLESLPQPQADAEYCYPAAAVAAFLKVGKTLIFSEDKMEEFAQQIQQDLTAISMPQAVLERSQAYGEEIANAILAWADKDNYKQTRTFPKYSITETPGEWVPTPPAYMDGIEPSWNKIRPFVLQDPEQFAPAPPTPYSLDKNSQFYREVMEVYEVLNTEDRDERLAIAEFWDCNPYVTNTTGHVMFATKKITPGGHWIGIAGQAARMQNADMMKTTEAYTRTAVALADAFISCWDEKYRSRLLRPETFINEHLDENWLPALQTPPFPEYTSGHSVISRAAAVTLTEIFGDSFAFADSVEVKYGLPVRSFESFIAASEEAAVSRLYGGIHYRPACDNGVTQGQQVGEYILAQVEWHEEGASQLSSKE